MLWFYFFSDLFTNRASIYINHSGLRVWNRSSKANYDPAKIKRKYLFKNLLAWSFWWRDVFFVFSFTAAFDRLFKVGLVNDYPAGLKMAQ